jgi:hypothetical protein
MENMAIVVVERIQNGKGFQDIQYVKPWINVGASGARPYKEPCGKAQALSVPVSGLPTRTICPLV